MESRLQSNEVRIPKTLLPQNPSTPMHVNIQVSSSSTSSSSSLSSSSTSSTNFVVNNSLVNGSSSYLKSRYNENSVPANLPEFDFNAPCQYFKSSFARSLSLNSANQTKSLDFGINFGLSRTSSIKEEAPASFSYMSTSEKSCNGDFRGGGGGGGSNVPPSPLPRKTPSNVANSGNHQHLGGSKNCRNVWSSATSNKQNLHRRSLDCTEMEVLRLRKECQNLIEENRRLMGFHAGGIVGGNLVVPGNSPNIEAVILQTQVDTLQWQLKQVEASRQMYRAVMEEVVRFLERCHRNLDSMQKEQISRSKSIHHVYHSEMTNENHNTTTGSPRARSSTNLLDVQKSCSTNQGSAIEESTNSSTPVTSYNNFRDFTWRRSPKRAASSQLATSECDPEKLAQDAYRLLRTAQNLLNTQEPDLTAPKHIIELQCNGTNLVNHQTPFSNHQGKPTSYTTLAAPNQKQPQPPIHLDSDQICLTFSRKMNMRESRLSLRSSTDGSVHSTSSSKNETDEENNHSPPPPPLKEPITSCATEDESGFSSISSFQEIGLPLNSTMISPIPTVNSSISDDSGESNISDVGGVESRNSTLKAVVSNQQQQQQQQSGIGIEIGLPVRSSHNQQQQQQQQQHNHRRWDSSPAVPPRTTFHRFSTLSSDDSPTVLWV